MANPYRDQIIYLVRNNPNKYSYQDVADKYNITAEQVRGVSRNNNLKGLFIKDNALRRGKVDIDRKEYIPEPPNTERILVIGDLHEPFCLDEYFDFCVDIYKKYKCTHVIFIGDIIDNHAASYHESDPDGMGAGDELDLAIERIARWYRQFPKAEVIIGNHCRIIMRKASSGGVPRRWIRDFQSVLGVYQWTFHERLVYDNVQYIHGEGGTARNRCKKDLMSTVQGHLHTQAYTEHFVGSNFHIFGSQIGCGVDWKSYSMAYAKNFGKPVIGCMVILDHGKLPINILMEK